MSERLQRQATTSIEWIVNNFKSEKYSKEQLEEIKKLLTKIEDIIED
jgi:hypothetical protein